MGAQWKAKGKELAANAKGRLLSPWFLRMSTSRLGLMYRISAQTGVAANQASERRVRAMHKGR